MATLATTDARAWQIACISQLRAEIDRLASDPLDAERVRRVLADFDVLYAVASPAERKELLQLLVRRIVFRGPDQEDTLELNANVNLKGGGSIFRSSMAPARGLEPLTRRLTAACSAS